MGGGKLVIEIDWSMELDSDGVATFLVPVSKGLKLEDYEDLLSQEKRDEALVRRKLMTDKELEDAMLNPYESGPDSFVPSESLQTVNHYPDYRPDNLASGCSSDRCPNFGNYGII